MAVRIPRWTVIALVAMAVAACATTHSGTKARGSQSGGGGVNGLLSSSPSSTPAGGAVGASAGAGGGGGGRSASGAGSGISSAGGGPAGPVSGPGGVGAVVPGRTSGTISVGVATFTGTGQVASAGLKSVPAVEGQQLYDAVIGYLNAHGGFGGRAVVPVYAKIPLVTAQPYSAIEQSACATFTQDHHVFAVLADRPFFDGTLESCLTAKSVPFFNDYPSYYEQNFFTKYPLMSMPQGVIGERVVRNWIPGLQRQGYFDKGSKVGLVVVDQPSVTAVAKQVPAALAAIGLPLTAESTVVASDGAGIANSVLRMRSAGVDHVLIMDSAPALTILWPTQAQSQSYYPRYGLNSYNTPSFAAANVPSGTFRRAVGIGWWPDEDVDASSLPPPNAAGQLCLSIYKGANINVSDSITQGLALWVCGIVLSFKAAADHAPALSGPGIMAGLESLGTGWQSPITFGINVGPGHHDGASEYRAFGFADSCGCFRYLDSVLHPLQ